MPLLASVGHAGDVEPEAQEPGAVYVILDGARSSKFVADISPEFSSRLRKNRRPADRKSSRLPRHLGLKRRHCQKNRGASAGK